MRPIDADELKELRDKYLHGEIKFDGDEYDLIDKCPTIDVVPVIYGRWVHLGGTSGAAPRAALSLPLRAVGISLLKNTARIVEQKWNKR